MIIDHVGIAVHSIEKGIEQWQNVFVYSQATEISINSRQKTYVVFLEKPGSLPVKLIAPVDADSVVATFLQKSGARIHHLCFRCENLKEEIPRLEDKGCRILSGPEPREALENEDICFFHAGQGLNMGLIDTVKRSGRIHKV